MDPRLTGIRKFDGRTSMTSHSMRKIHPPLHAMVSSASISAPSASTASTRASKSLSSDRLIGDADADGEAAAEDRLRRNGDPAHLTVNYR
jgi:hypothetical protein